MQCHYLQCSLRLKYHNVIIYIQTPFHHVHFLYNANLITSLPYRLGVGCSYGFTVVDYLKNTTTHVLSTFDEGEYHMSHGLVGSIFALQESSPLHRDAQVLH